MKYFLIFFVGVTLFSFGQHVSAQELLQDKQTIVKAKVLEVLKEEMRKVPATNTLSDYQTLKVEILEGNDTGKVVTFEDDYVKLSSGDIFYLNYTVRADDGRSYYSVADPYRLPALYFFAAIFIVLVILIGGLQGLRGLISLSGSFLLIFYVLFPAILHGFSPLFVSVIVSSFIIVFGSYVTHGFNKTTSSAVLGMIVTILLTSVLAYSAVHMAKLTGFESEEAVYLNLNNGGQIDILGLLLGSIVIGLLGVLYDVSIGQAISVEELHRIAPHISRKIIYTRALRIGREHIGALVNTLAIAYVGAFLPLLLLFFQSPSSASIIVNREIFATEIIRVLIGSIGLVLAVPITTLFSTFFLVTVKKANDQSVIASENKALEHFSHH